MEKRALAEDELKQLFSALKKINFFASIPIKNMDRVIEQFAKITAPRGRKLIKEGREGKSLFVIKSGGCLVYRKKGWFSKQKLNNLSAGDFFGEMSLIYDTPTSATVVAAEPSEFFIINRNDFNKVLEDSPEVLRKVRQVEQERSGNAGSAIK